MGQGPRVGQHSQHLLTPSQESLGTLWGYCHQRAALGTLGHHNGVLINNPCPPHLCPLSMAECSCLTLSWGPSGH